MSKISLKSSSSGTATFTIESPATNTDRTLNLPDGSGALYNQSNILGTVSQSGGVPTGAIIERGSNANGEFVRYADGTQICTATNTVNFEGSTGIDSRIAFDSPASFANATVFGSANVNNLDAAGRIFENGLLSHFQPVSAGDSAARAKWVCATINSNTANINGKECVFFAIGRWF